MANSKVSDHEKRRKWNTFQFNIFIHYFNSDDLKHIYELDLYFKHIIDNIHIDVNYIYIRVGVRADRVSLRDCVHRNFLRLCYSRLP